MMKRKTDGMPALADVLNSVNAQVYISDMETGALLFCNNALRGAAGIGRRNVAGLTCWQALYGLQAPCRGCPRETIRRRQGVLHQSVKQNRATGRWMQHNDCAITWLDGRRAHLRFMVDVTRQAAAGRKKLQQEALISEVSALLLTSGRFAGAMEEVTARLGAYFGADRVHLLGVHEQTGRYTCAAEYVRPGIPSFGESVGHKPVQVSGYIRSRMLAGMSITENNLSRGIREGWFCAAGPLGVKSLLMVPVFIGRRMWGVLAINDCTSSRRWRPEDVDLCRQVASLLSVAIERRNIERELFSARQTLHTVLDNVPIGISWKDDSRRYLGCNKTYQEFFHVEEQDIVGRRVHGILPEDFAAEATRVEKALLAGHAAGDPTVYCRRDKNGGERWLRTTRVPVRSEYGSPALLLGVTEDITTEVGYEKMKAAQEENSLRLAQAALDRSQAKTNFLSSMSHEIRTPLNAIVGMLQVARDGAGDGELVRHCLDEIETAAQALLATVNEVLDISKIEADKVEIRHEDFLLDDMLQRVYSTVKGTAEAKGIHLATGVDASIPQRLRGDPFHIAQVLTNLLSNAVKFTPQYGIIQLDVTPQEQEADQLVLRFDVTDTGIGLTKEQCHQLFQPYEQADSSIVRQYGGTGLGLNIAQRVAGLLRSEIRVESEAGKGSTFSFSVRLGRAAEQAPAAPGPAAGLGVLLAGSNSLAVIPFIERLKQQDARVYWSPDIAETADRLTRPLPEEQPVDVVVLDFALSEQDEQDAMFVASQVFPPERLVLVTSGGNQYEKRKLARQCGIRQTFFRPFVDNVLLEAIGRAAGRQAALEGARDLPPDFSGKTVLLAEDMALNRELVRRLLEGTGLAIDEAENGQEALRKYKDNPNRYQLILMDMKMHGMDGIDATIAIRAFEEKEGRHVPILALTASAFEKDRRRCLSAGMDGHLAKPLDKALLLREVTRWINHAPPGRDPPPPEQETARPPAGAWLDAEAGLQRLMNDRPLYEELLGDFAKAEDRQAISAAWEEKNAEELMNRVHGLKGVASNFGLTRLQRSARHFEEALQKGEKAQPAYHDLLNSFEETNKAIERFLSGRP